MSDSEFWQESLEDWKGTALSYKRAHRVAIKELILLQSELSIAEAEVRRLESLVDA